MAGSADHILVVPYVGQGHLIPLMELSHRLVENGMVITFVIGEHVHARLLDVMSRSGQTLVGINMVSFPYIVLHGQDRLNPVKRFEASRARQHRFRALVENVNASAGAKIKWVIADESMWWAHLVAKNMGIRTVFFGTMAAEFIGRGRSAPTGDGNVAGQGEETQERRTTDQPSPVDAANPSSDSSTDLAAQKDALRQMALEIREAINTADLRICNTFEEAEPEVFLEFDDILAIGPLLARPTMNKPRGHLWPEDPTCRTWLDQQRTCSVIYAAFGSSHIFSGPQLEELALALELTGRPFLWVLGPYVSNSMRQDWLLAYQSRVADRAKLVSWCPQQEVLAHPSIACFFSHCGWNSTLDGLSNGVPFLCWPQQGDQFYNQYNICVIWQTGLSLGSDRSTIMSREHIKDKIDKVLANRRIGQRAVWWCFQASMSIVEPHGLSYLDFKKLVAALKA